MHDGLAFGMLNITGTAAALRSPQMNAPNLLRSGATVLVTLIKPSLGLILACYKEE